jgi:hypothetical protein
LAFALGGGKECLAWIADTFENSRALWTCSGWEEEVACCWSLWALRVPASGSELAVELGDSKACLARSVDAVTRRRCGDPQRGSGS